MDLSIQLVLFTTGVFSLTVLAQKRQNLSPNAWALSRLPSVRRVDEDGGPASVADTRSYAGPDTEIHNLRSCALLDFSY